MYVVVYNVLVGETVLPKDLLMKVWARDIKEAKERFLARFFNNNAEAIDAGHDIGVQVVAMVQYS